MLPNHKSGPTWPKNVKVAQKLTFLSKIIGPQRLLSIHIDGGNDKQSKLFVLGDVLKYVVSGDNITYAVFIGFRYLRRASPNRGVDCRADQANR